MELEKAIEKITDILSAVYNKGFSSGGPGAITPRQLAKRIKRTGERIVLNKAITEE